MSENDLIRRAQAIEAQVGHPGKLWDALKERVQTDVLLNFADVQQDWLHLMWSLDQYRRQSVPPEGMGNAKNAPQDRLEAVYRSKGNWFAILMSLLLQNRTSQRILARTKIPGFSQVHQIDLAWPDRTIDPLICVETKVTGAPAYGTRPARGALSDWTNRRKELKFAATDLKLARRQANTQIRHWDVWRGDATPKTYFLWAARLKNATEATKPEVIGKLVTEARAMTDTYLEGVGLLAWTQDGDEYKPIGLPPDSRVHTLDDVLHRIESEIKTITDDGRLAPPAPQVPEARVVDLSRLIKEQRASYD